MDFIVARRRLFLFASLNLAIASLGTRARDTRAAGDMERAVSADRYALILSRLAARSRLDEDAAMLSRVRRIARGLIATAARDHPGSETWAWETHVSGDPAIAAFCLAGGKILVGSEFVKRLELSDGELAMLLAHEIAHALAEHRRAPARDGMDADPTEGLRITRIAAEQEAEADRIGMGLAHRAGWPSADLVGFFEKLAADRGAGSFSSTHPSSRARVDAARALASQLGP